MQATGACLGKILGRALLDDDDINARYRELGSEHKSGWSCADDDDVVVLDTVRRHGDSSRCRRPTADDDCSRVEGASLQATDTMYWTRGGLYNWGNSKKQLKRL